MNNQEIKKVIENFLSKMTVVFDSIEIDESTADHPRFIIKTNESGTLIGHGGDNISAINFLIKRIVNKGKTPDQELKFVVDVNDYYEKAIRILKDRAMIMADRVKSFGTPMEMDPMSSYERMIVHSMFSEDPSIMTESTGFGKERKIVIKKREKLEDMLKI